MAWDRWRRPLAVVVAAVFALSQWERLSSGEPFAIATAVGAICFFASMLWRRPTPPVDRRTSADAWRESARAGVIFFSFWFAVACIWLATAALLSEVRPANIIVPAIPGALLATNVLTFRGAEKVAALHAGSEETAGTP